MLAAPDDGFGPPPILLSTPVIAAHLEADVFFAQPERERIQRTFEFDAGLYGHEEVRAALVATFGAKCAYCETPLGPRELHVDQFRPPQAALDLDGTVSPVHYWWLAYTWENLYPCCTECGSFKGTRFPVRGRRSAPRTTGEDLRAERALLLDPRVDAPESHLVYDVDGTVASTTEEGATSIELLGLNRARLVADRREQAGVVRREWDAVAAELDATGAGPQPQEVEHLFATDQPFAAMRRQLVLTWLSSRRKQVDAALANVAGGISSVEEVASDVNQVSAATRRRVKSSFDQRQRAKDAYTVAPEAATGAEYFGQTRRIERIVVHNFKVIRDLDLQLPTAATDLATAPWLMLLGENGCGKSSLLQAVGLALMGQKARDALGLDPRASVSNGAQSGSVEVHFSGVPDPVRISFSRRSPAFKGTAEPKGLLLGYGATRLLPGPRTNAPPIGGAVRVENMFDPFSPIGNATGWLLQFDRRRFDLIARALKRLMGLDEGDRLVRNGRAGRVEVEAFGSRVPLEHLSDGYQSVVALATDVMAVLLELWPSVDAAEGTVLIDELGAHLHPRWRMKIVPSLREVFPRVQFLASTHDPLCLRGLGRGEVVVMTRGPDGGVVAVTDLPDVSGLRVDQLLTSEAFGLNSTIDPELDALFAEYYLLKAKRRRTAAENRRHEELRAQLDELQVLGTTRRERLVLEAADEFLARESTLPEAGERLELKSQTRSRIADIWEKVNA